jgi:hypothetical protein
MHIVNKGEFNGTAIKYMKEMYHSTLRERTDRGGGGGRGVRNIVYYHLKEPQAQSRIGW